LPGAPGKVYHSHVALLLGVMVGAAAAGVFFALAGPAASLWARRRIPAASLPKLRLPRWLSRLLAARRLERIRAQLPEAIVGLATSVRAGLSLPQAVQAAGKQVPDPLGREFRAVASATSLGATLETALDGFEARIGLPEARLLVAGLKLARTTGGSLGPLLDRLAETLRERERLRGHVKVLTAQGRLSGWVVGGMPVALLLVMSLVDPAFTRPLLTTPVGWAMLSAAVVLEGLGVFMIRAIVKVEP